ncbi:hypothetical protein [Zunongwangia sp. H14]|uniref:hypothetical protein n=1 Tax=Zunongwangia sp. H14 TaxID=3240792 RepID=UPI003562B3D2
MDLLQILKGINFTSLDVDAGRLFVQINSGIAGNEYQSLTFLDNRFSRKESLLDLGNINLKKRVNVRIIFNITEPMGVEVNYLNPEPVITIDNWTEMQEVPEEPEYSKNITNYLLVEPNEEGDYQLSFETLEDSEVLIKYAVDGITREAVIPISGEEENPYEFNP